MTDTETKPMSELIAQIEALWGFRLDIGGELSDAGDKYIKLDDVLAILRPYLTQRPVDLEKSTERESGDGCTEAFEEWYWKDGAVNIDIDISEKDARLIWKIATSKYKGKTAEEWCDVACKAASDYCALDEQHKKETAQMAHDIQAYRGGLGYSVPGYHDGRLTNGETPICGLCDAKAMEQKSVEQPSLDELAQIAREASSYPSSKIIATPSGLERKERRGYRLSQEQALEVVKAVLESVSKRESGNLLKLLARASSTIYCNYHDGSHTDCEHCQIYNDIEVALKANGVGDG